MVSRTVQSFNSVFGFMFVVNLLLELASKFALW